MTKLYYTLVQRIDGKWHIEFGDHDRDAVNAELDEYHMNGSYKKDLRILTTGPDQASINAAVAKLNGDKE